MNDADRESIREGILAGSRYAISAPRLSAVGCAGGLLGKAAGSSLEFMDHREYQPGDDIRRIDWSAYARTDRLIVRLYREEITPHLDIILDTSLSMSLENTEKRQAALSLAAAAATAAGNGGFSHAAWVTRESCRPAENAASSPMEWGGIEFDSRDDLHTVLNNPSPPWRPRSYRILISDLMFPGDPSIVISRIGESASALAIVQLLAEADMDPPDRGNIRLVDSESGDQREIYLDATAQKRYRQTLDRHRQMWNLAARQTGTMMATVTAERFRSNLQLPELVEAGIFEVE